MKIKIKMKKQIIDELSSVSGGSSQGSAGVFSDNKAIDKFNDEIKTIVINVFRNFIIILLLLLF